MTGGSCTPLLSVVALLEFPLMTEAYEYWEQNVPELGHAGWLTPRARMRVVYRKFAKHRRTAHQHLKRDGN